MEFVPVFLILLMIVGAGILFFRMKNKPTLPPTDDSAREHESVYEMPQIRMTDEGELTDSFVVQMKTLKKYRDEIINDENQE